MPCHVARCGRNRRAGRNSVAFHRKERKIANALIADGADEQKKKKKRNRERETGLLNALDEVSLQGFYRDVAQ